MLNDSKSLNKKIADRLNTVMLYSNLEILGLSVLTEITENHIYSILTYRRRLTEEIASRIGEQIGFDGRIILDLNKTIPKSKIGNSQKLKAFKEQNKLNDKYFLDTKKDRSIDHFIQYELLLSDLFNDGPKYLKEIRTYCKTQHNKTYTSDELSKGLKYAASKSLIKTKKQLIKKIDGTFGTRMVDVFYL